MSSTVVTVILIVINFSTAYITQDNKHATKIIIIHCASIKHLQYYCRTCVTHLY